MVTVSALKNYFILALIITVVILSLEISGHITFGLQKESSGWARKRIRSKGYRLNTADLTMEDDVRGKTIISRDGVTGSLGYARKQNLAMNLPPVHMKANGERRTNPAVLNSASGRLGAGDIVME